MYEIEFPSGRWVPEGWNWDGYWQRPVPAPAPAPVPATPASVPVPVPVPPQQAGLHPER